MKSIPLILIIIFLSGSIQAQNGIRVKTGAENLITEKLDLLKGKNLGIVTNQTSVLSNGTHLVDTLLSLGVNIKALFAPEHGLMGMQTAGETVDKSIYQKTSLPVYSLYGRTNKPSRDMLKNVDLILFDIQDTGARFYTYISTLFYTMQAAAENNIPVIVLDRPNPAGGLYIDGPVRKDDVNSFLGIAPIPITYGLTIGELAAMFAGEGWIGKGLKHDLTVIKMKNWTRDLFYEDCGIPWVNPSPNITDPNTAIVYPGTCLLEGTNISEGRGTYTPFLTVGAPFINPFELILELKNRVEGVKLTPVSFIPEEIPDMAPAPKYLGQECKGIFIKITDRKKFQAVKFGFNLISALYKLYPEHIIFNNSFDLLAGNKEIKDKIKKQDAEDIIKGWQKELTFFNNLRNKYLLYKDSR